MKKSNRLKNQLDNFKNALESETSESKKAYESSRLAYEFALKSFIIKNISSKKGFPSTYKTHLRNFMIHSDTRRDVLRLMN